MATSLTSLPIFKLDSRTLPSQWNYVHECINDCSYISLDLELSGLGNRKGLQTKSIEDRYTNLIQASTDHSVLSLGIACFKWVWSESDHALYLTSQIFDIVLHSTVSYLIEPSAVKFLVNHGFDFNFQYCYGLPYTPMNNYPHSDGVTPIINRLIRSIISSSKPLILHNGFIDLIYIYSHFYCPLPGKLGTFVSDLSEIFSNGIYDTKYIAEFGVRTSASYLEYIIHKSVRINESNKLKSLPHVHLVTDELSSPFLSLSNLQHVSILASPSSVESSLPICNLYANWGYCYRSDRGLECNKSHHIMDVLVSEERGEETCEEKRKKKKRKRKRGKSVDHIDYNELFKDELLDAKKRLCESDINEDVHPTNNEVIGDHSKEEPLNVGHRAGVDAFSTGYCLASFVLTLISEEDSFNEPFNVLEEYVNKLSLGPRHPMPLNIVKSQYSHTSNNHKTLIKLIKGK